MPKKNIKTQNTYMDCSKTCAIYGRQSHSYDNNTRENQFDKCMAIATKNNLALHAFYFEKVTAVQIPIYERKEFHSLICDAKAGRFKTLIVSTLDRLVRRYDDWIQTKEFLNKYSIKLIFADKGTIFDINSPFSDIIIKMELLNAIHEAENIKSRTDLGKAITRANGEYSSGGSIPLGYSKIPNSKKYSINIMESKFINYLFQSSTQYIKNYKQIKYTKIGKDTLYLATKVLNNFSINGLNTILCTLKKENDINLIKDLIELLSTYNYHDLFKSQLNNFITVFLSKKHLGSYVKDILLNPVYTGLLYMIPRNTKNQSSIPDKAIVEGFNTFSLDYTSFNETTNIDGFIDRTIFESVYCYIYKLQIDKKDLTPHFIFKKKLKCSCGKNLYLIEPGILSCNNKKCHKYHKDTVLELVLSSIIDEILLDGKNTFNKFIEELNLNISRLNKKLNYFRKRNAELTDKYILNPDEFIEASIYDNTQSIEKILNLIANHECKKALIKDLKEPVLNTQNLSPSIGEKRQEIKSLLIFNVLNNEDTYSSLLNGLIKEVIISYDNKSELLSGSIQYEVTTKNSSCICACIN